MSRSAVAERVGRVFGRESARRRRRHQALSACRTAPERLEERALLATLIWTGDLATNGWNDGNSGVDTNWNTNTVPADNDVLVFPAVALQKTNVNNTNAGNHYRLDFLGNGYDISGNSIAMGGTGVFDINDTSGAGSNIVRTPISFVNTGNSAFFADSGSDLQVFGAISGGAANLTHIIGGAGTVEYLGALANSYTSPTNVQSGLLVLDRGAANGAIVAPLVVGDGVGPANSAQVDDTAGSQIANVLVTVNSDGLLLIDAENIGPLTVNGGRVTSGPTAGFSVFGDLNMTGGVIDGNRRMQVDGDILTHAAATTANISIDVELTGSDPQTIDTADGTAAPDLRISGDVSGSRIDKIGTGWLELSGTDTFGSPTNLNAGRLIVNGSITSDVNMNGGSLFGNGTVGAVTSTGQGGTISAGNSPGTLLTGNLSLDPTVTLLEEIDGAAPGAQYDEIITTGFVSLNNPTLNVDLSLLYVPPVGTVFTIINNDGIDPTVGQFAGLPDGSTFFENGTTEFRIFYNAGDGNDVVLLVVGPPVAHPDFYVGVENQTLFIPPLGGPPPAGVLANDNPAFPDTQAVYISGPTRADGGPTGTLTLAADGSFTFTPAANVISDPADPSTWVTFQYAAYDGVDQTPIFGTPIAPVSIATVTIIINSVNESPIAQDDNFATNEDTPLTPVAPGVLVNDYSPQNPPAAPLTANLIVGPAHADPASLPFVLNADGSFSYTPAPNFFGTDSFLYFATDSKGNTSGVTLVTITVNPVPDAPTPVDDAFSINEGDTLIVAGPGILANDTNPDAAILSAFMVNGPTNGTAVVNADGSFTYTPNAFYNGPDSFTYRAMNGLAVSAGVGTVNITVNAVNNAPVARDDTAATNENVQVTISVLANDTDVDGDPLFPVLGAPPVHGSVVVNLDGTITYTPNIGYNGPDFFTYRASDGALLSDFATVNIAVAAVNQAPVAFDDGFAINEGSALVVAAPGVVGNDIDPDGDPLSSFLISGPSNGNVVLNSDGSFVYTPNQYYNGPDSFTYQAWDGALLSNVATVNITVNPVATAPIARDDVYSTLEDNILSILAPGILINDTNPDGTPITITIVNGPLHGGLLQANDGSFSYFPDANFHGTDSYTYYLTASGLNSNTATVTLNVIAVNDAPTVVTPQNFSTNEDVPLIVGAPGVLIGASDPDGDALSAVLVSGPLNGSVALASNGSFTYTPNANFNGVDSFVFQAWDGSLASNFGTVIITVNPVADVPVAVDDSYGVLQGDTLSVATPGILLNDFNPDNLPVSIIVVNGPLHGTLTPSGNPWADGAFTYTPNVNYSGVDSFTYYLSTAAGNSNAATVALNVVTSRPTAVDDHYAVLEGNTLNIAAPGILLNDVNPDNLAVTPVVVNGPLHATGANFVLNADGSFSYTSDDPNFFGTDSFQYYLSSSAGNTNTATVTINVIGVNDAPTVVTPQNFSTNEDVQLIVAAPGVLIGASDPDGDPLSAVLVDGPLNGSVALAADGSFVYSPNANFNGADSFTFRAWDGTTFSNLGTVIITVNPVADVPVAVDDSYGVLQGNTLVVAAPGILLNDFNPDNLPVSIIVVNGPLHGTLTPSANPWTDGAFTYTPNVNFTGVDSYTYYLSTAAGNSNTATVALNVVTSRPTAVDDHYAVIEGNTLNVAAPGVLLNDVNPDNLPVSIVVVNGPLHGTLTPSANPWTDGAFSYTTTDPNFFGTDSFQYYLSSSAGNSNIATVTITVLAVNDAPTVITPQNFSTNEDVPLFVAAPGVLIGASDPDGNGLSAILVNGPLNGSVALASNGSFTYSPNPNFNGVDSFTFLAWDGTLFSNLGTVIITVNPVADVPVAVDDSYGVLQGTTLNVAAPGILLNDFNPDNLPVSIIVVNGPLHGTLTPSANPWADGAFTYTPSVNYTGIDSFVYYLTSSAGVSNAATVTLNVVTSRQTAIDDDYAVLEGNTLTVAAPGIMINDLNPDSLALTPVVINGPLHATGANFVLNADGSFTYTTDDPNYFGTDSFKYYLSSSAGISNIATVTINILPVADAPVAVDDAYTTNEDVPLSIPAPGVLSNDVNVDKDALHSVLIDGPFHGSVAMNPDGSFTYTPDKDYFGPDSFTYIAVNTSLISNVATVSLTVRPVADAPIAVDDTYSLLEDTTLNVAAPGILLNDYNPDGGTPLITVVNGPLHGTLTVDADGAIHYTPVADYFGTDSFTYYLTNSAASGLTSNRATVTLTIVPVPDAPVAVNDSFSTNEDVPLSVAAPGVLYNDVNVDKDLLRSVVIDGPLHGSVELASDGSFVYTPYPDYFGPDSFTYVAVNTSLFSNTATVSINVRPVPDAPVARDDFYTTEEDETLIVPAPGVLGNDTDADPADVLTAVLVNTTQHGSLVLAANGGFVYVPNPNFVGVDYFTYKAYDGVLFSNLATVTINVVAIPPTTIQLDPQSDTGDSDTDRITKDNTPTFFGTTRADLEVRLYVRPYGTSGLPTQVGSTIADSVGNWAITSSLLADGTYDVSAAAFRVGDHLPTGIVYGGIITIDTVAPRVTNAFLVPSAAQVYATFVDDRVGMSQPSLGDIDNYNFVRKFSDSQRAFAANSLRVLPPISPTTPQRVVIGVNKAVRTHHGVYFFQIISGGVADVAGNALDGEFTGAFPSGNGSPGGNFVSTFKQSAPGGIFFAQPPDGFVPIFTPTQLGKVKITPRHPRNKPLTQGPRRFLNGNGPGLLNTNPGLNPLPARLVKAQKAATKHK